jgi:hypothetical protein
MVRWLVRPSVGLYILGVCEKYFFSRVQEYHILTHYPVVPVVVGTNSSGDTVFPGVSDLMNTSRISDLLG